MKTKTRLASHLLATTFFCGSMAVAAPAFAQDQDQDNPPVAGPREGEPDNSPDAQGGDENIVITGSRIPQPNLTATSPVTVVNSQEVRLTGTTRTEDLINSLPQAFAAQGANIANGSTGTANLNLRGLGSDRTLVLVNGRRLVPGSPNQATAAADINIIPAAMIDRVDVLTGGASSVYGADAVAGVVNFIMDTDFEGIRLDTQYSFYQHENGTRDTVRAALDARGFGYPTGNVADGGTWDISLAIGAGFDDGRGHVTAYAGYRNINAVLQGKRDYSSCALSGAGLNATLTEFSCGGSATSNETSFFIRNFTGVGRAGPNRTIVPGTLPYNFGPLNHFQRPDERYVAGMFAEYEISQALQPYMEFMFMDDRTVAQIAPSGNFFNTTTINCDNPLLGASQRAVFCAPTNLVGFNAALVDNPATPLDERATIFNPSNPGGAQFQRGILYPGRRNVEGGGRQDTLQHVTFRVVAGMRGDLSSAWSYDGYYSFGRVNFSETYLNDFSVTRLGRALDVIDNPATAGVDPVCRSTLDGTDPNCVPYDIFTTNPGAVTQAALGYLQTPGFARGFTEETVAGASLTGSLGEYGLQFPWANSGVGVALGAEYRKEALSVNYDTAFQTGDLAGQGAASLDIAGNFDVREVFAEARIPIIEESFLHELSLEVGYRYSDYQVDGGGSFSTDTYKIAGFFAPIPDVRFRGGYNRAVRAPNINELFAPQRVALNGSTDPCAGAAVGGLVNGFTAAQCARTGVTAAQFGNITPNPAEQYNGFIGGNPNLDPEIADTYTLGVVIQPRFIPRLALTVDWFDIEVRNAIQQIGQDTTLEQCITTGDPTFCNLIVRAPGSGSLWAGQQGFVIDTTQNIGGISTRGVDIGASYNLEFGPGNLGLNFVGTWLDELITDPGVPNTAFDCVGEFGNVCGIPSPEWRHTARVTYTLPNGIGITTRWRHFGSVVNDSGDVRPGNDALPSVDYLDLALSFRVGDHYNFRLGVNNLLDRDPPINGSQVCPAGPCNGNTWAQVYDALGRYIFAGVTLDF